MQNLGGKQSVLWGIRKQRIGPDLPKQVIDMRKRLIPKMVQARKDGKRAAFSRTEPYKLFIDGVEVKS